MQIALSIAPIFVMILLGYALRRGGIPSAEFWNLNDRLVYFILMPAVFFAQISTADLGAAALRPLAGVLYIGLIAGLSTGILGAWALGRGGPVGTSVMQGAARFNTFIALAIAEALYGAQGLQIAVLAAAILVPAINLMVVLAFAVMVPRPGGNLVQGALRNLVTNPLILTILAALGWNFLGLSAWPVLHPTLEILGRAALPIMLLCVGANLKLRGLQADLAPMLWATAGKLLVFPLVVLLAAMVFGLTPLQAQVALIFGALPVGVAAYTLARQLGGDAPLMAAMITGQTLVAFVVMPVWLSIGARVFGL